MLLYPTTITTITSARLLLQNGWNTIQNNDTTYKLRIYTDPNTTGAYIELKPGGHITLFSDGAKLLYVAGESFGSSGA